MTVCAPRIDPRLRKELDGLTRTSMSPAEIRRALTRRARELGLAPPSYEHVRRLVLAERLELEERRSEALPLIVDVAFGFEHGNELLRVARGEPRRRR